MQNTRQTPLTPDAAHGSPVDSATVGSGAITPEQVRQRLQATLNATEIGTWNWDLSRNVVVGDRNLARLFGDDRVTDDVSLPLDSFVDRIHPEDRPRVRDGIRRVVEDGTFFEEEYRVVWPTGEVRWLQAKGMVQRDAAGQARTFPGVVLDVTARRLAEHALRESERRYRELFHSIDEGFCIVQMHYNDAGQAIDYTILDVNDAFYRHTGFPPCVGKSVREFAPGLDQSWFRIYGDVGKTGVPTRFRNYDQALDRWFDVYAFRCEPAEDRRVGIVFADVSDRERVQRSLQASELRFRQLANAMPQLVWVAGDDGQVEYYNARSADYEGIVESEGRYDWIPVVHPDDQARTVAAWQSAVERSGDYTCEHRIRMRDGSFRWHLSRAVRETDATGAGKWFGTATDIHDVKLAQSALSDVEHRFHTLADNIAQLAWMTDAEGFIVWYNQRWFDYTGTTLDQVRGWGWKRTHHPDHVDRVVESFSSAVKNGSAWEDTFPIRDREGEYRWFLSRALPIRDADGQITAWFGTNTDITDLRNAQAETQRANEAKDRFLAVLSHELRTPLSPVLMGISSLESDVSLSDEARQTVAMIRRNIEIEARLIDDLLDVSRVISGKLKFDNKAVSVHEVLRHAIDTCRDDIREKRITLHTQLDATHDTTHADAARLQQVFWNLLKNAVRFTPAGGRIELTSQNIDQAVRVRVRDDGIGIDRAHLATIFDPFEQVSEHHAHRFGGLGLGLAISRGIVDHLGGRITADSAGKDLGATFTVDLPLAMQTANQPTSAKRPATRSDEPDQPVQVLLVEDHLDTARVLAKLLTMRGYRVHVAHTVADAIRIGESESIQLLLSDVGLPDGSGYDVARALVPRGIRGIAMTGYGMEEDIRRAKEAGFCEHITKPVDLAQLTAAIARVGKP